MFGRIVVGVAKTESAKRAASVAADLANRYAAEIHLVTAFDKSATALDSAGRRDAQAFLELIETAAAVPMQLHAIPGDPADTLLMVAEEVNADLIVVGNRGMRGAHRLLGSVPNTVAHAARCSVLIVDTSD
jgi:nucleotide-binding universal stress UspA family protein